jgi:hypothetical protein
MPLAPKTRRLSRARLFAWALALAVVVAMAALAACGQPTGQPLSAIHEQVDSWEVTATTDAACLDCHDRASIVQATRGFDGQDDVNVHEPPASDHQTMSCVSCHRAEEPPVLTCNQTGCHAYTLPENWISAP